MLILMNSNRILQKCIKTGEKRDEKYGENCLKSGSKTGRKTRVGGNGWRLGCEWVEGAR